MEREERYMERAEFTEDELIAALVNALDFDADDGRPPNTWRTEELKDRIVPSWSVNRIRARIKQLITDGQARPVEIAHRTISGRLTKVTAYQFALRTKDN